MYQVIIHTHTRKSALYGDEPCVEYHEVSSLREAEKAVRGYERRKWLIYELVPYWHNAGTYQEWSTHLRRIDGDLGGRSDLAVPE